MGRKGLNLSDRWDRFRTREKERIWLKELL